MPRPLLPPRDSGPEAVADREAFRSPAAWRRSKRGNLWRYWEGKTVTIFARPQGGYAWCVVSGDDKWYSPGGFSTESEALDSVGEAIGVGWSVGVGEGT